MKLAIGSIDSVTIDRDHTANFDDGKPLGSDVEMMPSSLCM